MPPFGVPAQQVVILGAARTPIGKFGGAFKDVHAAELGAIASRAALERAGVAAEDVEEARGLPPRPVQLPGLVEDDAPGRRGKNEQNQ